MDDQQFDGLKQFITATVGQSEARLVKKIEEKVDEAKIELKQEIQDLRQEMRERFAGVGDPIQEINTQVDDHEVRIVTLEQKAA